MRKFPIILIFLFSLVQAGAQYITEVMEYVPAPGQFINSFSGTPSAASSICGGINGSLSLGAFGGYVVFRFEEAVEDHPGNPYGVDFTIFGNPLAEWSEPGIVWVMKDVNGNGLPDDTWYQLAGSDHYFSTTMQGYRVTYTNPGGTRAKDVPWSDQMGNSGVVRANGIHSQPYYPSNDSFPGIPEDSYTLEGTRIEAFVDTAGPTVFRSVSRAFGYADNRPRGDPSSLRPDNPYTREMEHSGGDAFDIAWAVDTAGRHVNLDSIHFIKVQSGVLAHGGWLGEISTEITGAVDVAPGPELAGVTEMIVIRDLPAVITATEIPLEVFVFEMGRIRSGTTIRWETDLEGASVDGDSLLHLTRSGEMTLTAILAGRPEIRATVTAGVQLGTAASASREAVDGVTGIYPNPAGELLFLRGTGDGMTGNFSSDSFRLTISDAAGRIRVDRVVPDLSQPLDISGLQPGLYIIHLRMGPGVHVYKFIKE